MENKSLELLKALAEIRLENSKRVKQNKDDDCKINLPVGRHFSIDDAIAAINKLDKIRELVKSNFWLLTEAYDPYEWDREKRGEKRIIEQIKSILEE